MPDLIYSLETLIPPTFGHAFSVLTVSGVCGWQFYVGM